MKQLTRYSYRLLSIILLWIFCHNPNDLLYQYTRQGRYLQALTTTSPSPSPPSMYNQSHIERAVPKLHSFAPRLLVFHNNIFEVYNIKHNSTMYHDMHDFNYRPVTIIPLLVHTLRTHFPHRFAPNMPPFQLLFTDSDSLRTDCVNPQEWSACDTHNWPPILVFGSLMKDAATTFPTAKLMPTPPFVECLYSYIILKQKTEQCPWGASSSEGIAEEGNTHSTPSSIDLKDLQPTIIWRGSDYAFLFQYEQFRFMDIDKVLGKDLTNLTKYDVAVRLFQHWNNIGPRWRSVALSLQAELEQLQQQYQSQKKENNYSHYDDTKSNTEGSDPITGDLAEHHSKSLLSNSLLPIWINSRFAGPMPSLSEHMIQQLHRMGVHVHESEMSPEQMAMTYRYHIDLGGGGGTTWMGTISKLRMPGILFHHETLTQDWYQQDPHLFVPWKHYIPIHWDLTDLRAKYDWAEAKLNSDRVSSSRRELQQMSQDATELANFLLSPTYLEQIYQSHFVTYLSQVLRAYRSLRQTQSQKQPLQQSEQETPPEIPPKHQQQLHLTWKDCLKRYRQLGFQLKRLAACDNEHCTIQAEAIPTVESMRKLRHEPYSSL